MPDTPGSHALDGQAICAVDLTKTYGHADSPVYALRGVTFEGRSKGERVAAPLGKSGSGKSTLLNLLGGLDRPTSGSLDVAGHSIARLTGRQLARFRYVSVGMIFQSFNLIHSRNAWQNVELPLIFAGQPPRERRVVARRALEAVGLAARLDHRPAEMSGGENQRVAIARALANRPQILLADEPTGNLDSATAREVVRLIREHVEERQATLILVTHDEDLAAACTDRLLRLKDGQLAT